MQKLLEKVEHYKIFWDNAETNCRLEKQPLPDEQDDGSFTGFDYSFFLLKNDLSWNFQPDLFRYNYFLDEIKSETNSLTQKLEWIKKAFNAYMKDYYYEAKVRLILSLLQNLLLNLRLIVI